jgi:hypothetical protein
MKFLDFLEHTISVVTEHNAHRAIRAHSIFPPAQRFMRMLTPPREPSICNFDTALLTTKRHACFDSFPRQRLTAKTYRFPNSISFRSEGNAIILRTSILPMSNRNRCCHPLVLPSTPSFPEGTTNMTATKVDGEKL